MTRFTIVSCLPWVTFKNWTESRPLSLLATWMLIIRSGSNLWSPTDCHDIAAFDFANLSGCTQPIKETTHKLHYWLQRLLTNFPCAVDPPLGNFDHSSISFSVKIGFKILNITFPRKVYLKSRVDWPRVGESLRNFNWSVVYNSPNSVSELNKVITFLIEGVFPLKSFDEKWMIKLGLMKIV